MASCKNGLAESSADEYRVAVQPSCDGHPSPGTGIRLENLHLASDIVTAREMLHLAPHHKQLLARFDQVPDGQDVVTVFLVVVCEVHTVVDYVVAVFRPQRVFLGKSIDNVSFFR
jgi:hypothetical protein